MNEHQEIERLMRRTRGYWFADGLAEMALGPWFLLMASLFYWEAHVPLGSQQWAILSPASLLIGIGFPRTMRWFIERIKAEHGWPGTGCVAPERRPHRPLLVAVLGAAFGLITSFLVSRGQGASRLSSGARSLLLPLGSGGVILACGAGTPWRLGFCP